MQDEGVFFEESYTISSNLLEGRPFDVRHIIQKASDTQLLFLGVDSPNITHVLKRFVQSFNHDETKDIETYKKTITQEFDIMHKMKGAVYVAKVLKMHICEMNKYSEIVGYILMEYTGHTLRSYLREHDYTKEDVEKWFGQSLKALVYADAQRIYHGDITLDNITIDAHRDVRIVDFGTSMVLDEEHYSKTTTSFNNKTKGRTSVYLPPEVIQNKLFSFKLVDVYCFGMTFYYLAARDNGLKNFSDAKKSSKAYKAFLSAVSTATEGYSAKFISGLKGALEYSMENRLSFDQIANIYFCRTQPPLPEEEKQQFLSMKYAVGVIALGPSGAGKTKLLQQLSGVIEGKSTVGIDFFYCREKVNGATITLRLIDTCGQEREKSIVKGMYHMADIVLFVFDVTKPNDVNDLRMWIGEAKENCFEGFRAILVANKMDLTPCVSERVQRELTEEVEGMELMKISALKATGTKELKALIMKKAVDTIKIKDSTKTKSGTKLSVSNATGHSKCWC